MVPQPCAERAHDHVMLHGDGVPPVPGRPAAVGVWEGVGDPRPHAGDVVLVDEDVQPRSPAVVGGPGGVEAEDIGTGAQQGGGVGGVAKDRPDHLGVETFGQVSAGDEHRHRHGPHQPTVMVPCMP